MVESFHATSNYLSQLNFAQLPISLLVYKLPALLIVVPVDQLPLLS